MVKICGLRRPKDVVAVNRLEPDLAGFILSPGYRRTSFPEQAQILRQILSPRIRTVGVFVDAPFQEILQAAEGGWIDMIQLHGKEDETYIQRLSALTDLPLIKAFRIQERKDLEAAAASPAEWILLDSGTGTGRRFDWDLLEFMPGSRSWTGTYETNFKTLYLLQSGDTLTGSYPDWDDGRVDGFTVDGIFYGYWYESPSYAPPTDAGQLVAALYPDGQGFKGWWRYGNNGSWKDWSAGSFNALEASDLTVDTVYTADANHLIPDELRGTDLTEGMTIAEFAALSVRVYEEITGKEAEPAATPYTQVEGHLFQSEIEKAYGLGILKNIKADSFRPDEGFSRQLLAVMFCNLIKVCEYEDCTFDTIGSYTLEYTASQHFADEADIDPLAIDCAYYLTSNGLMDTGTDGRFDPAGKVMREQAVIMAYKFFESFHQGVG